MCSQRFWGSERFRNVWSGEIQEEPQVNSDHKDLPSEHAHEGIGQREKGRQIGAYGKHCARSLSQDFRDGTEEHLL